MKRVELPFLELVLIAATRGMLGAGIGLLVAGRLPEKQRMVAGRVLLAVGALSTIPLAADVLSRRRKAHAEGRAEDSRIAVSEQRVR